MSDEGDAFVRDLLRVVSALTLSPPTASLVAALTDPDAAAVVGSVAGDGARRALDDIRGLAWGDALRQEFFDLLATPTERYLAPFESVWCDPREVDGERVTGLLGGPSAVAVAREYARHGFTLGVPEQPDHLGCELAFLAALSDRDAASDFARAHPLRFARALAERASGDRDATLYPAVLSLAAALVDRVAG